MVCDLWLGCKKASPTGRDGSHRADQELPSLLLLFPRPSHVKLLENTVLPRCLSHT